ncbi:MAG: hypothetical protein HXS46_18600 [Theionarchaea archaeon]|nr:MAG: hypothetical protein AYK18_04440 [Theionarchaea archaeon DG-70]MBU7012697.1 hypothetical protein [Theionarchaea archaeon]
MPKTIGEVKIDFENIYKWFHGTIYPGQDCGKTICGKSACCYPHYSYSGPSYIYYLPGELEFLRARLNNKFPAREIEPGSGRFHCFGNAGCIREYRPIDCRSYPFWPIVKDGRLLALLDVREPRCPIKKVPDSFFETIKENWIRLLEIPMVANWLEYDAPKPNGKIISVDKKEVY